MTDLADRINRLRDSAAAEAQAKRSAESAKRQAAWSWLKSTDPEQAAWVEAMAGVFGKPEAIRISGLDGVVFEHGRLA